MNTMVIPGVQVSVTKEALVPQLPPSGVIGIVGVTAVPDQAVDVVASWQRFTELYGAACARTMPEAMLAFQNGASEMVVSPVKGGKAAQTTPLPCGTVFTMRAAGKWANGLKLEIVKRVTPSEAVLIDLTLKSSDRNEVVENLRSLSGENFRNEVQQRSRFLNVNAPDRSAVEFLPANLFKQLVDAEILVTADKPSQENIDNKKKLIDDIYAKDEQKITLQEHSDKCMANIYIDIARQFTLRVNKKLGDISSVKIFLAEIGNFIAVIWLEKEDCRFCVFSILTLKRQTLPEDFKKDNWMDHLRDSPTQDAGWLNIGSTKTKFDDVNVDLQIRLEGPKAIEFQGGDEADVTAFKDAIDKLNSYQEIDIVVASVPSGYGSEDRKKIYDYIIAHCRIMSSKSCGRIGVGQIAAKLPLNLSLDVNAVEAACADVETLVSDRFVMAAPHGAVGAIAGMIARLDYQESPTFKSLSGLTDLSPQLLVEQQEKLLSNNIVPVVTMRGRGTVVLRGLTTDGDQINVRRIADRAVRGVRMIGELFIGRLNTAAGRGALQEKLTEFLIQMVRDGALVPSAVGNAPPFQVTVSASNQDFAQGIVRVDIAVRPVRAIDYIYASVLVET